MHQRIIEHHLTMSTMGGRQVHEWSVFWGHTWKSEPTSDENRTCHLPGMGRFLERPRMEPRAGTTTFVIIWSHSSPHLQQPCRCKWAQLYSGASGAEYIAYHDTEWGTPCVDDSALFEHLVLDGAQCGLSWSTILSKRRAYRRAFKEWDIAAVSGMVRPQAATCAHSPNYTLSCCLHDLAAPLVFSYTGFQKWRKCSSQMMTLGICKLQDEDDVQALMEPTSGIVRHRGKIASAISNAALVLQVQKEYGSFSNYLWSFMPKHRPIVNQWTCVPPSPLALVLPESWNIALALVGNTLAPLQSLPHRYCTGLGQFGSPSLAHTERCQDQDLPVLRVPGLAAFASARSGLHTLKCRWLQVDAASAVQVTRS
jgi:DNA-3-methyladenine glycosylase I